MSLVSSLNIARSALSASQSAITVVSNNIANMDNTNYSKQTIDLSDVVSYSASNNAVGQANALSGVQVSTIERASSDYLTSYYRQENTASSYLTKYSNVATSIENITNELNDSGVATALSTFYSAVSAMNQTPTDSSLRENYISAAKNLCSVFNTASSNLSSIQSGLVGSVSDAGSISSSEIATDVSGVNELLDQIADVNTNIQQTASSGITSSSLLDERDSLLKSLSALVPVNVTQANNGTVTVAVGNNVLVKSGTVNSYLGVESGDASTPAHVVLVDENSQPKLDSSGNHIVINSSITSGTIGAILDSTGSDTTKLNVSGVLSSLNTLANGIANIMNTIQVGDPSGDGSVAMSLSTSGSTKTLTKSTDTIFVNSSLPTSTTTTQLSVAVAAGDVNGTKIINSTDASGNNFTNYVTTSLNGDGTKNVTTVSQATVTAANMSVNSAVVSDKNQIAAARVTSAVYVAGTYTKDTGNNSNTQLISASSTKSYTSLGNQTINGYLSSTVTDVGTDVKSISDKSTTQTSVLAQVKSQLSSVTGVDMEEELTDMIKYQRAYQAASRVFSACNTLMDTLINLGK